MTTTPADAPRMVLRATLEPLAGSIFQPTGFPDLGAAEFERPGVNGTATAVLVESVQSMANHLEATGWDAPGNKPATALESLPYVRVESAEDGSFLTSSRTEPHRLASAYVKGAEVEGQSGIEWITEQLGLVERRPLNWARIYRAIFEMDPLCLIHGAFFSDPGWKHSGNPKVRRAITAVIEAHNVERVVSGGLKRDDVQFTHAEGQTAEEGYGFVPYGRTEYTAERIELSIVIDLAQIRGYGLGEDEARLLELIALWEIAGLLEEPLRLRTACDLDVTEVAVSRPTGFSLPTSEELAAAITESPVEFAASGPRAARWPFEKKAKK